MDSINTIKGKSLEMARTLHSQVNPMAKTMMKSMASKENPWLVMCGTSLFSYGLFSFLLSRRLGNTLERGNENDNNAVKRLVQLAQIGGSSMSLLGVLLALQGGLISVQTTFEWEQFQTLEVRYLRTVWVWLACLLALVRGGWMEASSPKPWLGVISILLSLGILKRQRIGNL
jgi:hypothetical protein